MLSADIDIGLRLELAEHGDDHARSTRHDADGKQDLDGGEALEDPLEERRMRGGTHREMGKINHDYRPTDPTTE